MGVAGFHLGPVVDRLAEHLKTSTKLFMDETTGPVLDPGRGRTKTGYLWSLARDDRGWGGDDPPGRYGTHAETFLTGFNGTLSIDGYTDYNRRVRTEWLGRYHFESIEDVQDHATKWLWTYNNERPSMGIGGMTPIQKLTAA